MPSTPTQGDGSRRRRHVGPQSLVRAVHDPMVLSLPVDPDVESFPGAPVVHEPRADRRTVVAIGLAGTAGTLARYFLQVVLPAAPPQLAWATLLVNLAGCLLIGIVVEALAGHFASFRLARPIVVTGFLGGFTTFSTYAVGTDLYVRDHALADGVGYGALCLVAGVLATWLGLVVGRVLTNRDPA